MTDPGSGMPRLLINMITRACYSKPFKKRSGWQGMSQTQSSGCAWTFKIRNRPGLFGVSHVKTEKHGQSQAAEFMICYFPRPDEEMVDLINLRAAITVHQPGYIERVRDFISREEMIEPFCTGRMVMELSRDEQSMGFSLESALKKRIVSEDGIKNPDLPGGDYLVPPGGYEADLPCFDLSMDLFSAVCAAATFNLEAPPVYYERLETPGQIISYNCVGEITYTKTGKLPAITETLGYGPPAGLSGLTRGAFGKNSGEKPIRRTVWNKGEPTPGAVADQLWWKANDPENPVLPKDTLRAWDKRPQLIVLTGFLGAGKTSFVKNFVEYHNSRNNFVAVIQNEIGETGLDGKLLESNCNVVEMDEGCVCCTLAGRLSAGISGLMESFGPEVILLETTGLANPFNLLAEIDELSEIVRFDSITTVVDSKNALHALDEYEIACDQVRAADIVILNKTDLVDPERLDSVSKRIRRLNPGALLLETKHGNLNPGLLYNDDIEMGETAGKTQAQASPGNHGTWHIRHACHGEAGIGSIKINFDGPVVKSEFVAALEALPPEILRLKGLVRFNPGQDAQVCQYVGGRVDFSRYDGRYDGSGFVVVIGKHLNPGTLPSVLHDAYHSTERSHDVLHPPVPHPCSCHGH
jgi:G3E family GTPase